MDGVKSEMVTWTVGRAGEGLHVFALLLPMLVPLPLMPAPLLSPARTERVVKNGAMDGVKNALVTWTAGRAGEGLQGLGCTISTAANSCTIVADAVATLQTVRVLQSDFIS